MIQVKKKHDLFIGKPPMTRGRVIKKLMGLLLALGIFANGIVAGTCLCGKACLHGWQEKSTANASLLFHSRCFGVACKSCNVEKGQTPSVVNVPVFETKTFDTISFLSMLVVFPSSIHVPKNFASFYATGILPSCQIHRHPPTLRC